MAFVEPADVVLSKYLRSHRALGQHDRAFIAQTVFGVLRHARTLEHIAGGDDPRRLTLAWLARFGGSSARELGPALQSGESEWLAQARGTAIDTLPPPVRAEL